MSPEQENHLYAMEKEAMLRIDAKYRRGQKEHGGDLFAKPGMLDMTIDEAIDLLVYLLTLRDQLENGQF